MNCQPLRSQTLNQDYHIQKDPTIDDLCDRFQYFSTFTNDVIDYQNYGSNPSLSTSHQQPPLNYMCHLCFMKGHFIRDCPQVNMTEGCILNELTMKFYTF